MIAKELATKHQLKQTDVAELLGVSQPAISLYYRKIRGKAIDLSNDQDITKQIRKIADTLTNGKPPRKQLIPMYCETCRTIRAKGLLCKMHKTLDPTIAAQGCDLCTSNTF
jgi:predicted transcriptional regulator